MPGFDLFQLLVIAVLLISVFVILAAGANGLKIGFLIFILLLGLGYRTISFGQTSLHPAELLIWVLFLLLLLQRRRWFPQGAAFWAPRWVWILVPFWILAGILGFANNRTGLQMLQEAKNFIILFPMAIIAWTVLQERENWKAVALAFFITGVWIGGMGLLEYVFPGLVGVIPGFASNPDALVTLEGFRRATFSFYGAPVAVFTLALSVTMGHVLWDWTMASNLPQRRLALMLILAGAGIQFSGIYIGGYRSVWLVMIFTIALWAFYRFGSATGLVFSLFAFPLIASLVPLVAEERFISMFLALEGNPVDSSAQGRLLRAEEAWARTMEKPWGSGWAGSGWVHNDFLQISAGQGLLVALLVAGAWLNLNFQLVRHILVSRRAGNKARLPEALSLALFTAGGVMLAQGTTWLVQLAMPIWLAWVLASVWLYQHAEEADAEYNRSKWQTHTP
jgi:hypothetical protein